MTNIDTTLAMDSDALSNSVARQSVLASLFEVLELNAYQYVTAITELRRLITVLDADKRFGDETKLNDDARDIVLNSLLSITRAIAETSARSALIAANRLKWVMEAPEQTPDYAYLKRTLLDIESRFTDELTFVKLFVMAGDKVSFYDGADRFLSDDADDRYPSVRFDCDEAGRCLALARPTASVFHSMRMIEVAVGSLAKRLGIPDPIKPAERNWGIVLGKVKAAMEQNYTATARMHGSEGAFIESVYVTLDAIKNPWRNTTMHVESVYTDEEARHIFSCVVTLLNKMAGGFDEAGQIIPTDTLIAIEG